MERRLRATGVERESQVKAGGERTGGGSKVRAVESVKRRPGVPTVDYKAQSVFSGRGERIEARRKIKRKNSEGPQIQGEHAR